MPAYPLSAKVAMAPSSLSKALAPPTLFVAGPKGDGASPHFRNGDRHRVFRRRIAGLALHNHRMGHVSMDWSPRKDQLGRLPAVPACPQGGSTAESLELRCRVGPENAPAKTRHAPLHA